MPRVLIIDDNPAVREVMKHILLRAGWEAVAAASAKAGLELLQAQDVDIALVDIEMPQMDGYDFCTYLKTHPRWGRLPVVLMTGRSITGVPQKAQAVGAVEVVSKPFDTDALLARMRRHVDAARDAGTGPV
jgi:CheY-like chemotaxis protein